MNRSFTIADQLHAIIYTDGRASVPTIEVDPDEIDEITEVELVVCSCRRHTGRHPVVATRRLHARH